MNEAVLLLAIVGAVVAFVVSDPVLVLAAVVLGLVAAARIRAAR